MRPKYVIGNWKMNTSLSEGRKLAEDIHKYSQLHVAGTNVKVVICPPHTHLGEIAHILSESVVQLGAQDCHYEPKGAFTGDVSASMIAGAGAQYCIIGHSERRMHYGEPNKIINAKLLAVLRHQMTPILCFGETAEEKHKGKTEEVITNQLQKGLAGISREQLGKVILAYEPVWAISTSKDNTQGQSAQPEEVNKIHQLVREKLKLMFNVDAAREAIIIYGGSVKPENAREFFKQSDIDGGLPGAASLNADTFTGIIDAANLP